MNRRPARPIVERNDSYSRGSIAIRQRETRQLIFCGGRRMKHGTGIETHCTFCGNEQRIDFDFRNPSLFDDEMTEANENVFERSEIDWSTPSLAI